MYQLQSKLPAELKGKMPSVKQLADVVRASLPVKKGKRSCAPQNGEPMLQLNRQVVIESRLNAKFLKCVNTATGLIYGYLKTAIGYLHISRQDT